MQFHGADCRLNARGGARSAFAAKFLPSAILAVDRHGTNNMMFWNEIEGFNRYLSIYIFCECAPMATRGDALKGNESHLLKAPELHEIQSASIRFQVRGSTVLDPHTCEVSHSHGSHRRSLFSIWRTLHHRENCIVGRIAGSTSMSTKFRTRPMEGVSISLDEETHIDCCA